MAKKRGSINILFPCVGRRVVLLGAFYQACRRLGLTCKLVGADMADYSAGLQCCDRQYVVPPVSSGSYPRAITDIIRREKIDLVVPTLDPDLTFWASRAGRLKEQGCTVLISSPKVVKLCQDKRLMAVFLTENGFNTPCTFTVAEALKRRRHSFPYFLKPWDGSASKGSMVVRDKEALAFYGRRIPHCMVQEFNEGVEHTVDVLVDFKGQVRCVVPRRRIETRGGEVTKGITVKHTGIIEETKELVETLGAGPGVITIQCFLTPDEQVSFIEINPRFGGGVPLSIKAGADFPRWLLQWWLGQEPRIDQTGWRDQLLMLRYDAAVWVEDYHELK